jgi:hypothetical protein
MVKQQFLGFRQIAALALMGALAACGGKNASSGGAATNQAPTQVMLVEASSVNAGAISASWLSAADDSTPATSLNYQLHASTDPAFTPSSSTKVFEGLGVTSASVSTLTAGQTYTVRLVALDAQGASTASDPITVTVSATTAAVQPGVQAQTLPAGQVANVTATSFDLPVAASAPAVGSFVTSTEANSGQGFLRKVLSVSTTAGVTTVQTAPAALNEVFSDLEISSNVTMDAVPAPVAAAAFDKGQARVLARARDGSPTEQRYDWPNSGLSYSAAVGSTSAAPTHAQALAMHGQATTTTGSSAVVETVTKSFVGSAGYTVTNTIQTSWAPKITFNAKLGLLKPTYSRIAVSVTPQLVQTLAVHATGTGTLDTTQPIIAPRKFTKILQTPAGIPVLISGVFQMDMRMQGTVTGVLDAQEKLTVGFTDISAGLEYNNGTFTPFQTISPVYALKMGGNGKASADLKISLLPSLELTGYEVLMGKVVLEPYLAANDGVEGHVQMDAAVNFDQLQTTLAADADFRLTSTRFSSGANAYVYADLHVLDNVPLSYPSGANAADYTTFRALTLLAETTLADLPQLSLSLPNGVGTGKNIAVTATATNTPNPLKSIFTSLPDSFIPWQAWTAPRLIPPVGVTTGFSVSGSNGNYLVNVTEPGTYTLRVGGYSSWGSWARQYTEIPIIFGSTGFTKISASGQDLPDNATTWSCVRHNATGLLWEAHVTRQAPAHPCSWDPTLTCTGYTNFDDGSVYDASAVTGSVCGKPGRLPTVDEGRALVSDPAYAADPYGMYQTWFGADDIAYWGWTSSPVVGSPSNAWYVIFLGGGGVYYDGYNNDYVRLVAGP